MSIVKVVTEIELEKVNSNELVPKTTDYAFRTIDNTTGKPIQCAWCGSSSFRSIDLTLNEMVCADCNRRIHAFTICGEIAGAKLEQFPLTNPGSYLTTEQIAEFAKRR